MSSWARVEPLVAHVEERGRRVEVTFRCPETGREQRAYGEVPASRGSRAGALVKRSLYAALRESVWFQLRRMFGWGFLGRFVSEMLMAFFPTGPQGQPALSAAEREDAVLAAFKQVEHHYTWDTRRLRFVSREARDAAASRFERLVEAHPVEKAWDRGVLLKMLAAVASADGDVSAAEGALVAELGEFASGTLSNPGKPLTDAELGQTSPSVRETMLLLCHLLACADLRRLPEEEAVIRRFAVAMGVSERQEAELAHLAREAAVERLVAEACLDGVYTEAEDREVRAAALRLGFDEASYEALEAATRRRLGVVG